MEQHETAFSLRETCKSRIRQVFIQLRKDHPEVKSYILVVDQKTLKITSAFLKMAEY
jgi:syntaxin-binding protein 1